ncbi:hypothetical protein ACHAXT_010088 [Thalassiosira profunda]
MASMATFRGLVSRACTAGRVPALAGRPPLGATSAFGQLQLQHQLHPSPSIIATSTGLDNAPLHLHQQRRTALTKTKKRQRAKMQERARRVARGLPAKPKPPRYIDKSRPVTNALTREERDEESRRFDAAAAREMQAKIEEQGQKEANLRFKFDGLVMSDRVKKLFDLSNGSQGEVVASQKRRGMELFQQREGDTGSSAVQVVALTTRIQQLQTHMAKHHKDKSTKRGLDALYVRRRKVLDYMERKDFESYRKVVKSLGLLR